MSATLSLRAQHEDIGARWTEFQGWEVPASYGDWRKEWEHVRRRVGLIDLSHHGLLRVVGRDRRNWLHGMVTNEVRGLEDGQGTYAAVLNVQGHMLTDMRIFAVADALLLELPAATKERVRETLDGYLMMEQAEIEDASAEHAILSVQGPAARGVALSLGADLEALRPLGIGTSTAGDGTIRVARVERAGEAGFDIWTAREHLEALWDRLYAAVRETGGGAVGLEALNVLRVEAGIPWWGAELDETIVPLEARLEHAISYHKGCYIGQEIIARIEARGRVNNLLVGLRLGAAAPPLPSTPLLAGGKVVGRTTTAVRSPALDETIALGFARREHAEPGAPLTLLAAGREITATVSELPFLKVTRDLC
jgi:folate-binding protein YgfZ